MKDDFPRYTLRIPQILLDKLGEAKPVRMDKQKLLTMIEDAYGC